MGAKDGAEIAELTGIYMLEQINVFLKTVNTNCHAGLYRDDGLIYVENSNGPLLNRIGKSPISTFQKQPSKHNYRTNRPNGKFFGRHPVNRQRIL